VFDSTTVILLEVAGINANPKTVDETYTEEQTSDLESGEASVE